MAVFQSAEEVYTCIGGLFEKGARDPGMGTKVRESKLVIRFEYDDPASALTIDARNPAPEGQYFRVVRGDTDLNPDVLMTMKADIAHQFWLGKVNLTAALTRGQMKAKGPIQSIMRLLPAIRPAFDLYREHLREVGRPELAEG